LLGKIILLKIKKKSTIGTSRRHDMKTKLSFLIVTLLLVTVVGCDGTDNGNGDSMITTVDTGSTDGTTQKEDGSVPVVSCVGAMDGTACGVPSCTTLAPNEGAYAYETSYITSYGGCVSGKCMMQKMIPCGGPGGDTLDHPCEMTSTGPVCH
jgi:hypothetical protein